MEKILIPNIGTDDAVEVIEILVKPGDQVDKDTSLLVLESDKASMEVPAPVAGVVREFLVKEGDKVKEGTHIANILGNQEQDGELVTRQKSEAKKDASEEKAASDTATGADVRKQKSVSATQTKAGNAEEKTATLAVPDTNVDVAITDHIHAGPAVRKLAREFGINLAQVPPTGPKGRVLKEDIHAFVQTSLQSPGQGSFMQEAGQGIDFARFGPIEAVAMSKIQKITADNMLRSWMTVPQVSQFEAADITELEAFRKTQKETLLKQQIRLTILPFVIKAVCVALHQHPAFNISLQGSNIIKKQYVHIGIAMDTPHGLMVPVIRDADQKTVVLLAQELQELADKAKNKKLLPNQMQGGCFSVSSLGSLGGTQFTPLVNAPEVGILGLSRAQIQPVYLAGELKPRLILPLVLSYDHRAVNGADALRFVTTVKRNLEDIRNLLM